MLDDLGQDARVEAPVLDGAEIREELAPETLAREHPRRQLDGRLVHVDAGDGRPTLRQTGEQRSVAAADFQDGPARRALAGHPRHAGASVRPAVDRMERRLPPVVRAPLALLRARRAPA